MAADFLIPAFMIATAFVILFFRTNVSLAVMGLCVGYVLSDIASDDVIRFIYDTDLDKSSLPIASTITILLTLLPAVLIIFRFKHSQKGRIIQHIFPAIAFSLLATLLVLLNLPFDMLRELETSSLVFGQFQTYEVLIVVAALSISVFDILVHDKERKRKYKKRRKKGKD